MSEINFEGRSVQKHDIEANWKAVTFYPKAAEIIIYDPDYNIADASKRGTYTYPRMKIGDGVTEVSDLPFINVTHANVYGTATLVK